MQTPPGYDRLAGLTEQQLYGELGAVLLGDGLGMGGRDDDQKRRFGEGWFNDRLVEIAATICTSELATLVQDSVADDLIVVTTYAALHAHFGIDALALAIAAIVCRRGLDVMCVNFNN